MWKTQHNNGGVIGGSGGGAVLILRPSGVIEKIVSVRLIVTNEDVR